MSRLQPDEEARNLLRRCCLGHCAEGNTHACERSDDIEFGIVAEAGARPTIGPLSREAQRQLLEISGRVPTTNNQVRLLADGVQTYGAMLGLLEAAKVEILFENFIFRSDAIGKFFADRLRERSTEGVNVRILHDPFGSLMSRRLPIGFRFHRSAARVRVYNPPRPSPAFWKQGRDHRKLVVADRQAVVTGGMCLADVWGGNCVQHCTWRDSAIWATGEVAAEAAREFEAMWKRGFSFTPAKAAPEAALLTRPFQAQPIGNVPIRLWSDERGLDRLERMLSVVFRAATREILVTNPYFLPTPPVTRALCDAARQGRDVQLIIPRTNNHKMVGLAVEQRLGELLRAGVRVWFWAGPMIHAKTVVVDRVWSLVGSSNLDPLSLRRNAEFNLEIHGSSLAEQVADLFGRDRTGSVPFSLRDWKKRSFARVALTRAAAMTQAWL